MPATAPTPVGGVKARGARPRTTGNQRRRRPPDDRRVDTVDDEINGKAPLPPHRVHDARKMGPLASASSRSNADRQRSRATVDSVSRVDLGSSATGRTGIPDHLASTSHVAEDQERANTGLGGMGSEDLLPIFGGRVEDQEESFPALPHASGKNQAPGEAPLTLSLPLGSATAGAVGLNYSSLAGRLAAEAAAAAAATEAAAKESSRGSGKAGESFSRLSVLHSFGGGRGAEARLRDASDTPPQKSPDAQIPATFSAAIASPPDNVLEETLEQASSLLLTPAPSQATLADHPTNRRLSAGASVETVALRARLRERWFRLEATRKAQRQREAVERELMAAEDVAVSSGGRRRGGSAALTKGHEALGDQPGGDGSRDSSDGGHDSEEDGMSSSAGGADDQGRPPSPLASSVDASAVPRAGAAADRSIPVSSTTGVFCKTENGASAGRGQDQSREVSAAGLAAIRRSKAANAASTEAESVARPSASSPVRQDLSVDVDTKELGGVNQRASPSCQDENERSLPVPSKGDACSSGGDSVVDAILGEGQRVHAACEAGMAGLLNDLLVRSAGRAADGKDKVGRRKGK